MARYRSVCRILLLTALVIGRQATASDALAGSWSGTVYEKGVGKYTVNVHIEPNAQSGRVEFTHYPCGGSLSLLSKSGAQYLYQERLTFGANLCADGLQARLSFKDANQLYFEELMNGSPNAYGNLYRTSQAPTTRRGCIEDLKPSQSSTGFTVFRFQNHCDSAQKVSVCVKSMTADDRAAFNPLSATVPPKRSAELTGGMWRHFQSYQWAEGKNATCPF